MIIQSDQLVYKYCEASRDLLYDSFSSFDWLKKKSSYRNDFQLTSLNWMPMQAKEKGDTYQVTMNLFD